MTLVPVTPAVRMIAKTAQTDPDGASMLARLAIFETVADFIEHDRAVLDRAMDEFIEKRNHDARRSLIRQAVTKRLAGEEITELVQAAEHLTALEVGVSKARPFDTRRHPRDPYSGRFVITLDNHGGYEEALKTLAELKRQRLLMDGATVHVRGPEEDPDNPGDFLRGPDRINVGGQQQGVNMQTHPVTVQEDADQMKRELRSTSNYPMALHIDPSEINRGEGHNRGVAFDAMSYAVSPRTAATVARGAPITTGEQFHGALNSFVNGSNGYSPAYNRLAAGGQALRMVTATGSGGAAIGGVAQLVGELGPQAENVLGGHFRRTAYRYRGTERRPDAALQRDVAGISQMAPAVENGTVEQVIAAASTRPSGGSTPGAGRSGAIQTTQPERVALYWANQQNQDTHNVDRSTDALDLRLRGDTAAAYLMRKLPNAKQVDLSRAAGRMPPSQGVIIDHAGNVVTEAQGFASDHYVPFDLKNLKRMDGGQYTRTRAYGGPTVEDIYTGLMSGARQVQVVSNSGLFTVEFDPDVRGGRRYSDKARNMIHRYQSILGVVANPPDELAYDKDVPKARAAEIARAALVQAGGDEAAAEPIQTRMLNRERALRAAGVAPPEPGKVPSQDELDRMPTDEQLMEQAMLQVRQERKIPPGARIAGAQQADMEERAQDLFHSRVREREEDRVRRLELNGQGYFRALQSLQQEFPYYIRNVDWQPLREFSRSRRLRDPGEPTFAGDVNRKDPGYRQTTNSLVLTGSGTLRGKDERSAWTREAQESSRTATAQRANGGGAGGAGGSQRGGGAPQTPPAGGVAPLPQNVPFDQPPHEAVTLAQLNEQRDYYLEQAGNAISTVWAPVTNLEPQAGDPTPQQIEDPKRAKGAAGETLLRALSGYTHNGAFSTGGNQLPQKLMQLNDPELTRKTVDALRDLNRVLDRAAADPDPQVAQWRQQVPQEAVNQAVRALQTVAVVQQPFVPPAADPALFAPTNGSQTPQRFQRITDIPLDPRNVDAFAELANNVGMQQLRTQYNRMKGMEPEARARLVHDQVGAYRALTTWAQNPQVKPAAVGTRYTIDDARDVVANPNNNTHRTALLETQAAWSLAQMHDLAERIQEAGGGGTPFVPRPGQGPQPEVVSARAPEPHRPNAQSPVLQFAKALLDQYVQL